MGIDFTTHPKGKFHSIDKTRQGIKAKLEHLMNSTKERFNIKTINISEIAEYFCCWISRSYSGMIRADQ